MTDTADRELWTTRLLDAPRERVFDAWTDPAALARWWGPKGFTNTFEHVDVRAGGTWRYVMHGPDGGHYANESVFVEVVRPERVVIRHLSKPRFVLTATLDDERGKTRLTWRQTFETAEERDKVKGFAVEANEQNLDRLEAELRRQP